ncbi:MAG: NifB/NifX family molybdenum-iron cluster-binding protein [Candidatus Thorarchaeota archaeon]|jgi:predicted Fe-Mo cluster-binding NifX family protein
MKRRILIPTADHEGKMLAEHFGRAPFFVLYELDDSNSILTETIHQNTGSHQGGRGHAHNNVMSLNPHVVIVNGMGPRGIKSFQEAGVAVLRANSSHAKTVVDAYVSNMLSELTEGCAHAHHK